MSNNTKRPWHSLELVQIFEILGIKEPTGLSQTEVEKRRVEFGPNTLPKGKQRGALAMFFAQFTSPLVWILLVAAMLGLFFHEAGGFAEKYADPIIILVVVIVNAFIGLFQEYRANKIFEKLKEIVRVRAIVIRDGKTFTVDSQDLVPGDLIVIRGGSKVPADAMLIRTSNLEANEALLTGESKAVKKMLGTVAEKALVGDRSNMVFTGTVIERGDGLGLVVATGALTEIGQISLLTQNTKDEESPLQARMAKLGKFLTEVFIVISLAIFIVGLAEGDPFIEMVQTTVAMAVAAIPEGLPAAISIILAVASQKILGRKGLVRKLIAAETLGSTSVICTDKTGTLTYGEMKVEQLIADGSEEQLQLALALANEALLEQHDGKIVVNGEATDKAKLENFLASGKNLQDTLTKYPRLAMLPFEERRKYIASFHLSAGKAGQDGKNLKIFVTGAPEQILSKSTLSEKEKDQIRENYENLAKRGFRLIAAAERDIDMPKFRNDMPTDELVKFIEGLNYLGLACIRDPIREDVKETLAVTRKAGIKILMVTGDHILTAKAIGLELGFSTSAEAVITGEELDALSDKELEKRITKLEIIARVNPEHKMRIISSFQKLGAIVAMGGDGVNDAPALKAADIGVAVGSGTDVAKEASDLVLLDDSFSTITAAVAEGRTGFANIRKATVVVMSNAFTEILLIASTLITHSPFPVTAIQILWVNIVEDGLPVLAMAFEPSEPGIMNSKPVSPDEPILDRESKMLIFVVSLICDLTLVGVFLYLYNILHWDLVKAQSLVFVATATPTLINIFAFKSLKTPLHKIKLFSNKFLLIAVALGFALMLIAIYVPFFNRFLKTTPLPFWPALFGLAIFPVYKLLLVELTKWWYRRQHA